MADRPTDQYKWAATQTIEAEGTAGTSSNYVITPSEAKQNQGWVYQEKPARQFLNWCLRLAGDWINYLVEKYELQHDVDGTHKDVTADSLTATNNVISSNGYFQVNDTTAPNAFLRSGVLGTGSIGTFPERGGYLEAVDADATYNILSLYAWSGGHGSGDPKARMHMYGTTGNVLLQADGTIDVSSSSIMNITGAQDVNISSGGANTLTLYGGVIDLSTSPLVKVPAVVLNPINSGVYAESQAKAWGVIKFSSAPGGGYAGSIMSSYNVASLAGSTITFANAFSNAYYAASGSVSVDATLWIEKTNAAITFNINPETPLSGEEYYIDFICFGVI